MARTRNEIRQLKSGLCGRVDGDAKLSITNGISVEDAKELVRRAIDTYDADKTGEFDFALESAGIFLLALTYFLQHF